MSVKDLEPPGFTAQMRHHGARTKAWTVYVQGLSARDCGVWLSIDGTQTLIGYGTPDEALAEAEKALAWAATKLRDDIERFKDAR
jgi:hypothetical protein